MAFGLVNPEMKKSHVILNMYDIPLRNKIDILKDLFVWRAIVWRENSLMFWLFFYVL